MRLAIVGSQAKSWPNRTDMYAIGAIKMAVLLIRPDEIISGRSPGGGVDIWAEDVASELKIPFTAFEASQNDWEHFKARNIQMAEYCHQLISIRSRWSKTYGSGWTADYAEKIGKHVDRLVL